MPCRESPEAWRYVASACISPEWDGRISNSAFLIDPEGIILAQARKNNMWHFASVPYARD